MGTAKKVLKNAFSIAFSNITTKVIALIVTVYLARYLGVAGFGKYTFVTSYFMIFGFLVGFGLDPVLIKEISKNTVLASKIMSNAVSIRLLTSLVSIIIAIVGVQVLNYPADTVFYVYLTSIVLLFQGASYLIESLFQSQLRMHYSAYSQIISKLFFGIFVYFMIKYDLGLTYIFLAYISSEILRTILSYLFSKKILEYGVEIDFTFCRSLIKQALPFVLGYGLFVLYNRFDILMLSTMQGDIAVGFYSAAYKLTESVLFIPSALAATLMPVMAKQFDKDKNTLKSTYNLGNRYIFMLIFPITMGGTILANEIISFIYGESFSNSVPVFQVLALTIIFNSLNSIQTSLLISTNRQHFNNISVSLCAILNIALNFILIPKLSYFGAGVATLISVICLYLLGFYFIREKLGIQPLNSCMLKYIASSILMGTVILFSNLGLISQIILGAVIYAFMVLMLKGFTKDDVLLFKMHKKSSK